MLNVVRAYLRDMNVSERLAEDMLKIPPADVRYLSNDELVNYGVTYLDPVEQETIELQEARSLGVDRREFRRVKKVCEIGCTSPPSSHRRRSREMNAMWNDFEQRYVDARADVVADFSLFLVGQDEEDTQRFLHIWNGALERDILIEPPIAKSEFIWRLIESTMARVRAIAPAAPALQSRTIH